jgi:hypothetical protein
MFRGSIGKYIHQGPEETMHKLQVPRSRLAYRDEPPVSLHERKIMKVEGEKETRRVVKSLNLNHQSS